LIAKRIIPCLDYRGGKVVKGVRFKGLKVAGDPVCLSQRYRDEGADELLFLDVSASSERRKIPKEVIRSISKVLDIPFTIGGGISNTKDATEILDNGADKVAVNTKGVERPSLVEELSDRFGEQCVVVAIDAHRNKQTKSGFSVCVYGGSKETGIDAVSWAKKAEKLGAGEILLTSIDRDGTNLGYDIDLTNTICGELSLPIIASGGCGRKEDFLEVFQQTGADAALAASIFHYNKISISNLKQYLKANGVSIRC
jgi:cyclase